MKGFYQVTETIKNQLLADVNVNTVTSGDITRIDLSKQTMFPLSHIIVNNVGNEDNILRFSLSVLAMDVVDFSKEETVDIFRGNNNEQDIFQLDGAPNLEPFYDRFENEMAGWALTFDVLIPNDIEIC